MAARAPKIAKELNVSLSRIEDFLNSKGFDIKIKPTTKINDEQHNLLLQEFSQDVTDKVNIKEAIDSKRKERESVLIEMENEEKVTAEENKVEKVEKAIDSNKELEKKDADIKEIDVDNDKKDVLDTQKEKNLNEKNRSGEQKTLKGPVVTGETIDLTKFEKKKERVASSSQILKKEGKKKRKRIFKDQQKGGVSKKNQNPEIDNV